MLEPEIILEYPKYKPKDNGKYIILVDTKRYECEWKDNKFIWPQGVITHFVSKDKPIHVKPSYYAYTFEKLKSIALKYGYNLVLHGSMNRDLDLIAIPWEENILDYIDMIKEMANEIGGWVLEDNEQDEMNFALTHHGRICKVININRGGQETDYEDPKYYVDISIMTQNGKRK